MRAETVDGRIDVLRAICDGPVLGPDDRDYAEACAAWNLAWTQRPAIVVTASSADDVVHAVRHAADRGLAVAVQATGHGVTVPSDQDCVLIAMNRLDSVHIDPVGRTATVGGGTTWAPVLAAAQEHGLAPLVGSSPDIGAVGYSLGGGFGWLARRHGLAVDAVRSMRVVLADGRTIVTSETEEPELFWALCGSGGGALGVVVEMTVALAPVTDVYAGSLFYPVDAAREVFAFYREWAADAPPELTSAFNITAFPPLEVVPAPLRGQTFAIVRGCFADASDPSAATFVDRFRTWRAPELDMWGAMPFARCAEISQDPVDPVPARSSGRWLGALDVDVVEAMLEAVTGRPPSPVLFVEARQAGGAVRRPNRAVSYAGRECAYSLEVVGLLLDERAGEDLDRRFRAVWSRLDRSLAPLPGYLNFVDGPERVRIADVAFPQDVRSRLTAVKSTYDPHDTFRHGIPLAGGAPAGAPSGV